MDGVSGDLGTGAGPLLERIGSDAVTVVQESSPAGVGGSRSLSWINASDQPVADQFVSRVGSTGLHRRSCDISDAIASRPPRPPASFRAQQRRHPGHCPDSPDPVTPASTWRFASWSESGAPLAGPSVSRDGGAPRPTCWTRPTVARADSGSISVAHTGRHGQLAGEGNRVMTRDGSHLETACRPRALVRAAPRGRHRCMMSLGDPEVDHEPGGVHQGGDEGRREHGRVDPEALRRQGKSATPRWWTEADGHHRQGHGPGQGHGSATSAPGRKRCPTSSRPMVMP